MTFLEFILIGVVLALDAFTVSVGKGLSLRHPRPRHALIAGLWFGGFQALMPLIGYFAGHAFASAAQGVDHWTAMTLLVLIGVNMIRVALRGDEEAQNSDLGVRTMFILAVATSIDALAVGVSMAFLDVNIWCAIAAIGIVTLLLSAVGIYLGHSIGTRLGNKAGIVGGLVLVAIGIKIVVEHLVEGI